MGRFIILTLFKSMTKHSGDQKQTVSSSLESASQITEWLITGNGGLFEAKSNVWTKHKRLRGKKLFSICWRPLAGLNHFYTILALCCVSPPTVFKTVCVVYWGCHAHMFTIIRTTTRIDAVVWSQSLGSVLITI